MLFIVGFNLANGFSPEYFRVYSFILDRAILRLARKTLPKFDLSFLIIGKLLYVAYFSACFAISLAKVCQFCHSIHLQNNTG